MGRVSVWLLGLTVLLSACGASDQGVNSGSLDTSVAATALENSSSESVSSDASDDIVATDLDGKSFSLNESLKTSPVVLWFWAPG